MFNLTEEKKFKRLRSHSIINRKAEDMINKLESVPFNLPELKNILSASKITTLRRKVGRTLSIEGSVAVCIVPHKGSYILAPARVKAYNEIANVVYYFSGETFNTRTINGTDYPILIEYKQLEENGSISYSLYFEVDGEKKIIDEVVLSLNYAPVKIFKNNEDSKPDIEYFGVVDLLKRLNQLDNELQAEWNRTRTMPTFSETFGDDDGEVTTKLIDSGKKKHIVSDGFNEKYGNGMALLPATNGAITLQNLILIEEDNIYRQLGIARDTINSGSNQHSLELFMANEVGYQALDAIRILREEQWQELFNKLTTLLGMEQVTIKLELTPMEASKREILQSTILQAKMKANNTASQIKKGDTNGKQTRRVK